MNHWVIWFGGALIVSVIVVALQQGTPDRAEPQAAPALPVASRDLTDTGITMRDWRSASSAEQLRFCRYFTQNWFGHEDQLAAEELHLQINRLRGLPATTDHRSMMLAAARKTPLWESATGAAKALGWPK